MRSNTVPYFFLGLAAILAIAAVILLFINPSIPKQFTEILNKKPLLEADEKPAPIRTLDEPLPSEIVDKSQTYPESGLSLANPIDILAQIGKALENGDIETVSQLIGKRALNTENLAKLSALIADDNFRIRKPGGIIEIGELELNRATRWAIELEDREFGRDRILFDLRNEDGKWTIDKLILPPAPDELILKAILPDSLGIADADRKSVV